MKFTLSLTIHAEKKIQFLYQHLNITWRFGKNFKNYLKILYFIYLSWLHPATCQDLSSPTRDHTYTPCIGSMES